MHRGSVYGFLGFHPRMPGTLPPAVATKDTCRRYAVSPGGRHRHPRESPVPTGHVNSTSGSEAVVRAGSSSGEGLHGNLGLPPPPPGRWVMLSRERSVDSVSRASLPSPPLLGWGSPPAPCQRHTHTWPSQFVNRQHVCLSAEEGSSVITVGAPLTPNVGAGPTPVLLRPCLSWSTQRWPCWDHCQLLSPKSSRAV